MLDFFHYIIEKLFSTITPIKIINILICRKIVLCAYFSQFPVINSSPVQFPHLKQVELLGCSSIISIPDYLFHSPHLTIFNCVDCPSLALTAHQERILSHTVGVNITRCRTSDSAHLFLPKLPLDFFDDWRFLLPTKLIKIILLTHFSNVYKEFFFK